MIDDLKIQIRTAPIQLDDNSQLYSEITLIIEEKIRSLSANHVSPETMSTSKELTKFLSKLLTEEIGVDLPVISIYHHYNIQYMEKAVMVCIKITPETIESYETRGVPSFEDVFKDFA